MTQIENLHYAIGQLAYSIAHIDGNVQMEEREQFHNIVAAELRCKDYNFSISDIIFNIMSNDNTDSETSYNWAIKEIKLNSHYLSPQLKKTFVKVLEKIAKAYAPVTKEEEGIIERFKRDIESIHGDPIFYEKVL